MRSASRWHSCKLPRRNYQQNKIEPNLRVLAYYTTTYHSQTYRKQSPGLVTCRFGAEFIKVASYDYGLKRLGNYAISYYLGNGRNEVCRKERIQRSGTLSSYTQTLALDIRLFYFLGQQGVLWTCSQRIQFTSWSSGKIHKGSQTSAPSNQTL